MKWIKLKDIEKYYGAPLDETYLLKKKIKNKDGFIGVLDGYICGAIAGYEIINNDGFIDFHRSDIVSYYEENANVINQIKKRGCIL